MQPVGAHVLVCCLWKSAHEPPQVPPVQLPQDVQFDVEPELNWQLLETYTQ